MVLRGRCEMKKPAWQEGHISTCAIHAGARHWEGAKTRDDTLIEIRLPSPTTLAPKGAWSANGPGVLADGSVSGERS